MTPLIGVWRGRRGRIAAAVCCRWNEDGELRLGLVATRDGARWTFPKGHRRRLETPWRAAAREAGEEAGVVGVVDPRCLRVYSYPSRRGPDQRVAAFLLHVTEVGQADEAFRRQVWCDPAQAGRLLAEGRDGFHAHELELVLEATVAEAAASRRRMIGSPWGRRDLAPGARER
ncbi:MAG: hypothetical protein QOF77_2002 [Solirubrobacteraceae bacterium]|jgi:8-oxo-dGTP pyrophosphatase MutT (NUDIX family)|nr:hypothetical protein [Solirubrobacteraceae bacterium]